MLKTLMLACAIAGFLVGFHSPPHRAIAQSLEGGDSGTSGGVSNVTTTSNATTYPCPGGSLPSCARCTSPYSCGWACYGSTFCTIDPGWCANGVTCRSF